MAAHTTLPDGRIERYHFADLSLCYDPDCGRLHLTVAEFNTFDEGDVR